MDAAQTAWRKVYLIPLLALALGYPAPAHANPINDTWLNYQLQDFQVFSNLPRKRIEANIRLLRAYRGLLEQLVELHLRPASQPVRVIVFRKRSDFLRVTGAKSSAGYFEPNWRHQSLVAGPFIAGELGWQVLLHEYTHYAFRNGRADVPPLWYEEGIAEVASAFRFKDGSIYTGLLTARVYLGSHRQRFNLTKLLTQRHGWHRAKQNDFYIQSWALVHYLLTTYGKDELQQLAAAQSTGEHPVAVLEKRVGMSAKALAQRLKKYVNRRTLPEIELPISRSAQRRLPSPRTLDKQEVAELLASVALNINPAYAAKVGRRVNQSKTSTAATLALQGLAEVYNGSAEKGLSLLHQAQALAPSEPTVWLDLATAYEAACQQTKATAQCDGWLNNHLEWRLRAHALDPRNLESTAALGYAHLLMGDHGEALPFLESAHHQAPWSLDLRFHLGRAYAMSGQPARAKAMFSDIIAMSHGAPAQAARAERALLSVAETP